MEPLALSHLSIVELGRFLQGEINEHDIAFAHRFLTTKPGRGRRQLILRFSRRMAKVNILQNKNNTPKAAERQDVKTDEDLTASRLRVFNMMKAD